MERFIQQITDQIPYHRSIPFWSWNLGRDSQNTMGSRQLGSVCEQTGRKEALSEMFACCGWDVSPKELKRLADQQFVAGVNMSCGHLYAYSERGQRKRDYPCHYSAHNSWQKEQKDLEDYFSHLGSALSLGHQEVNTLVLHPIRTAYLSYKKWYPILLRTSTISSMGLLNG